MLHLILLLALPLIHGAPYVISPFNGANLYAKSLAVTTVYSNGLDFPNQVNLYSPTTTNFGGGDDFADLTKVVLPTSTNYNNGDDFVNQVSLSSPTTTNFANGDDFTDLASIVLPTSTSFANGDDFVNQVSLSTRTTTSFGSGDDFVTLVNVGSPTTTTSFGTGDDFVTLVNVGPPTTTTSFGSGDDFATPVNAANVANVANPVMPTITPVASTNDFAANGMPFNGANVANIAPTGVTGQSWMPDNSQPYHPDFFPPSPSDLDPFAGDPFGDTLYNTDANGEFTIIDVFVDPTIQTAIPNYSPGEQFEWYNDTPETRPTPTVDQPDPYNDNDPNDYDPSEDVSEEALLYAQGVVPLHVQQLRAHVQTADSKDNVMRVVNAAGDIILVHFQKTNDKPEWTLKNGVLVHP